MARIRNDKERFAKKLALVVQSLDVAHKVFLDSETFGGPSLHFHITSLAAAKGGNFDRFAEHVYALLSAWGMHRMGPGGSKMIDFKPFKDSLVSVRPEAERLMDKQPETLGSEGWRDLETVFRGIRCMESASSLVGHSKVMAHWLPLLVPPVDRTYTLKLLYGSTGIKNGLDTEWVMLADMLRGFFYPLLRTRPFKARVSRWMGNRSPCPWDSSALKIADNVVIGFVKTQPQKEKQMNGLSRRVPLPTGRYGEPGRVNGPGATTFYGTDQNWTTRDAGSSPTRPKTQRGQRRIVF